MAYTQPSGSFLHACAYSSLLLAVSREMFPTQPFFDLPPDKRRIVDLETGNLLLQSRWKCDSAQFATFFSQPQAGSQEATAGTVLGEQPPQAPQAQPGGYL
jgi:hypothetical protein